VVLELREKDFGKLGGYNKGEGNLVSSDEIDALMALGYYLARSQGKPLKRGGRGK